MIRCTSHEEALQLAFRLFPYSTWLDHERSKTAGYPIYYATDVENAYICDLNSRIEINYDDGKTENIHVEFEEDFNSDILLTIGDISNIRPFEYDGGGFNTIQDQSYLGSLNVVFDKSVQDEDIIKVFNSDGTILYSRVIDRVAYLQIKQTKRYMKDWGYYMEEMYFEVLKYGNMVSRNEDVVFGKVIHNMLVTYDGFLFQVTRVDTELVNIVSLGEIDE